ncbi:MAG: hypothetical protein ACI9VR_003378 [Cognaticolwellia sp.]|jgi:hypothetical protein
MELRHPSKKFGGLCSYCGEEFARSGVSRHLTSCSKRPKGNAKVLHLVVESPYWSDFWLHVLAPSSATLAGLDALLRQTWLECCGHLSSFEIEGLSYEAMPMAYGFGPPSKAMSARLNRVIPPGISFRYQYDFGSTTELKGRCVRVLEGMKRPARPLVVARNLDPSFMCEGCEERSARMIDTWGDSGGLCTECYEQALDSGDIDEDGAMPVVNSPRLGVCAYTG